MKANYIKPLLTVASFSPTQSGARDCADSIPDEQVNFNDISRCVWDLGGTTVFVAQSTCDLDGEQMGYACYNNPTEGNYIFRS